MSRESLISPISDWLIDSSLDNRDVVELFEMVCLKLAAIGIPIARARLFWSTLHPLFQAETVCWDRGEKAFLEQFEHQEQESEEWNRSPLKFVIDNNLDFFRRELSGPNELVDFHLLEELKNKGITDFLLTSTTLAGVSFRVRDEQADRGILVTWASDKPGGFSSDDIWALQKIQKRLAVACRMNIQGRISTNIAQAYLGTRAGENVLNGQIRRGDGSRINAVVWYSDLRDSTSLAETMEPDSYFALLNSFFSATAEPVTKHGGEILDFIGDAVLGIFPFEGEDRKCDAAKAATLAIRSAIKGADAANLQREKSGLEKFKFGIGLNVGEVQFGNIGIPSRLAFSVIGSTVNQAARIENMTKFLQQPVLANSEFASLVPEQWKSVGEHKLDGVLHPLELFSFHDG